MYLFSWLFELELHLRLCEILNCIYNNNNNITKKVLRQNF